MLLTYNQFKALQFLLAIFIFAVAGRALQVAVGYYEMRAILFKETIDFHNFLNADYIGFLSGLVAGLLCLFSLDYNTKFSNILKFVSIIFLFLLSWFYTYRYYPLGCG